MKRTINTSSLGDRATTRTAARLRVSSVPVWAVALLVSLVALVPRAWGLDDFYTIDEGYHWLGRVAAFSAALAAGDWAGTNLTGHPGVTTMWLGSLGRVLALANGVPDPGWAGGGAAYLGVVRLPLALVNALGVGLGYLLLRRVFAPSLALLAALLWASEPFVVAHSRVLHLDALLTTLLTLSLLALIAHCRSQITDPHTPTLNDAAQRRFKTYASGFNLQLVIVSGGLWGLALVTKAPSLVLAPVAALVLVALAPMAGLWPRLRWALPRLMLWGTTALAVAFIAWPALWVTPVQAAGGVIHEIIANGGQPHHSGNFFWGEAVAVPGPLFYGVVVGLRTTPVVLIGLLLLPLALQRAAPFERRALLVLLAFIVIFTLALTREPKKFDRYLLPVFPALTIVAAAGVLAAARALTSQATRNAQRGTRLQSLFASSLVVAIVLVFQAATLAWYHPYYLGYFNPLLGGGPVAQRTLLVGWGEGMEQAGAWLSQRPDLDRGPVLSWTPPNLAPFVPKQIPVLDLRPEQLARGGNYAVLYARSVQRQESAQAEAMVRQTPPLYEVRRHGLLYATIHQLPRPFETPRPALFGEGLRLNGFTQQQLETTLVVTPSWSVVAPQASGRWLFLHLLDAGGQRVAQLDAPIDEGLFEAWQAGQQFGSPLPLALPSALPQGRYRLVLGVYDGQSGERVPVREAEALPPELNGPHALLLGEVTLDGQ
jgi:4-amino-4-deoxy-L-arabinose transferase-like glycosyltransferase